MLPIVETEGLVEFIRANFARTAVPDAGAFGTLSRGKGVDEAALKPPQEMLMQIARNDYEGNRERERQGMELAKTAGLYLIRRLDETTHARIIALRSRGKTIAVSAKLANCSTPKPKSSGYGRLIKRRKCNRRPARTQWRVCRPSMFPELHARWQLSH